MDNKWWTQQLDDVDATVEQWPDWAKQKLAEKADRISGRKVTSTTKSENVAVASPSTKRSSSKRTK